MIRAEYAYNGYIVDLVLNPTTDDPRSHYRISVLQVVAHQSRGRADTVSPLVGDILDGATVHAIGATVLTDDDCIAVRRMLGLPPDDPHVVPTYDAVEAAGGTTQSGGCSYTHTDQFGSARSSEQATWMLHPTEGVILHLGGKDYAHDMAALRRLTGEDVGICCWLETPDAARNAIIAAGWPLAHATQAAQRAHHAEVDAQIIATLQREREVREGEQRSDETPPSPIPPTVETHHLTAIIHDKPTIPIRIKSVGFGATSDMTSAPIEDILRKQGAEIHYIAPAVSSGDYVGSVAGPLEEICYTLDSARWYLYVVTTTSIDDWCQEWWVSQQRLTADAAADIIEAARLRAYAKPPTLA